MYLRISINLSIYSSVRSFCTRVPKIMVEDSEVRECTSSSRLMGVKFNKHLRLSDDIPKLIEPTKSSPYLCPDTAPMIMCW